MKWNTEAAVKAVGIVLGTNVAAYVVRSIFDWLGLKPGIDYRAVEAGPEGFYMMQLAFMLFAFVYYRHKVKGEDN